MKHYDVVAKVSDARGTEEVRTRVLASSERHAREIVVQQQCYMGETIRFDLVEEVMLCSCCHQPHAAYRCEHRDSDGVPCDCGNAE